MAKYEVRLSKRSHRQLDSIGPYALNNPETNDDPSGHMIDMWSSGSTNMEPPAAPPAKPPVVTVPPQTPQSGEGSYRWGNMISNNNQNEIGWSQLHLTYQKDYQTFFNKVFWPDQKLEILGALIASMSLAIGVPLVAFGLTPSIALGLAIGGISLFIFGALTSSNTSEQLKAIQEASNLLIKDWVATLTATQLVLFIMAATGSNILQIVFTGGALTAARLVAAAGVGASLGAYEFYLFLHEYHEWKGIPTYS